jgi:cyclopropane fatty-acyl-phospholipid synthase-like methyltransferase
MVNKVGNELKNELETVARYWDDRAESMDSDCAKVDASLRAQRMRFEAFCQYNDVEGKSVLDLGCGVGDFSAHLEARGIACEYLGLDISRKMIDRCRERFPNRAFESGDILFREFDRPFDFVVSFGIHNNVRLEKGAVLLEKTTRRQFELSTIAAHVSILTDRYREFAPHMQAWRAEDVLGMALNISPNVILRHDYLPNDFCITLYREPLIDRRRDLLADQRFIK